MKILLKMEKEQYNGEYKDGKYHGHSTLNFFR